MLTRPIKIRNVIVKLSENGYIKAKVKAEKQEATIYELAKPAEEINVFEVFDLFENNISYGACVFCSSMNADGSCENMCIYGKDMKELECSIENMLSAVTLQELINRSQKQSAL